MAAPRYCCRPSPAVTCERFLPICSQNVRVSFFFYSRANSKAWTSTRSCMWVVTPTTHFLPKPLALRPDLLVRHCSVYIIMQSKCRGESFNLLLFPGCRLHPSAGHPRRGSDLQRPGPQLYGGDKLPHLQRPTLPGQLLLILAHIITSTGSKCLISSWLSFRTEEPARTRRAACTSAAAPEDSRAATASITHPSTVTQVHAAWCP